MKGKLPLTPNASNFIKLEYKGRHVLTTKQLCDVYGCNPHNIFNNFHNHKKVFTPDVDYFLLTGEELKNFKDTLAKQFLEKDYSQYTKAPINYGTSLNVGTSNVGTSNVGTYTVFCRFSSKGYLWTKSGAFKHAKFLQGYLKNLENVTSKLAYFYDEIAPPIPPVTSPFFEGGNAPAQPIQPVTNLLDAGNLTPQAKLELLNRYIELTTDETLRDKLISQAALLLKDF